jgi:geranylgeranylglyceryl phosphate synthase family protein
MIAPLALLRDRRGLAILVDPARTSPDEAAELAADAAISGAAALLIGGSYGADGRVSTVARAPKSGAPGVPLLQFPGAASQLVPDVDAVLLLSLVSGRNPQYLIEEHVRAVGFFATHPVPALSTAYLLIDGGTITSVESVSQTRPLPADKPELVSAHVKAAMLIGMQAVYLDTGSGARRPVAPELVQAARKATAGLLFIGGGVRSPDAVRAARTAGADYVVVGTHFERRSSPPVHEFVLAAQ